MFVKLPIPESTLLNSLGPLPRDGERGNRAAALAGDPAARGVAAQSDGLFDFGKDLFEQEARVLIGERVVFEAAIVAWRLDAAGLDEDADRHRNVALRDQVVEHRHDVLPRRGAILKHHHRRRVRRVVLRRHVDPPVARRARENLAAATTASA